MPVNSTPPTQTAPPRVRRATSSDAALLAELGARLFEETFGPANDPDDMRMYLAESFSEPMQRAELENSSRAIWLVEDATSGAIGYAVLARGTTADGVKGGRPAEIQRFYIDRRWHGRGLADALMQTCIAQCAEWSCDVLWLAVWERNPRAIAFYERMRFERVGRKTFTLGRDLQHDLVMAREP